MSRDRKRPSRRMPRLEALEGRELPSAALYLASARLRLASAPGVAQPSTIGILTPREARRDQFVAKFTGHFVTGPPQLTSESARVFISSDRGGSNQFLHSAAMVALNLPADPNQPVTRAVAAIYPQNVATTGSQLQLDLTSEPDVPTAFGLPTRLSWQVNGNSAGMYAGAISPSPGTLEIHYTPRARLAGGFLSGQAILVFRGTILTTGVGNIARVRL